MSLADIVFDPEDLIAEAERDTGLSDWGGDEFREPLRLIARSAGEEARLTAEGAERLTSRIRTLLRNRLRMMADRARDPAIGEERIVRPIFITGLPRAGTTHTHALMAEDPATRAPRLWEMLDPSPPARCDELDGGARLRRVQAELERMGFSSPEMRRIHQTDASTAEECGFIHEHTFCSRNFAAFWRMPTHLRYVDHLADHRPVYAFHRKFLQSAQHGCPGERWVLKAPMHLLFMDALLAVYPDAIIIQNHRDPARVLPSIANFITRLRSLFSEQVDPKEVAESLTHMWIEALARCDAVRRKPQHRDQFYDIHYLDIARRPVETIEGFYAHFGLPLNDAARGRMARYAEAREKEGYGADYTLAGFGLDEARLDALYADYMQTYGVAKETRS